MGIERVFENDARILELLDAAGIPRAKRKATEEVLAYDNVARLIAAETNLSPVKNKLRGARSAQLTEQQRSIYLVVSYLADFEASVSSWLRTKPNTPYAIEHVLANFDATQGKFTGHGTGKDLVDKLSFGDIQVLRQYSAHAAKLSQLYNTHTPGRTMAFTKSADEVARQLIGKVLVLPNAPLTNSVAINDWERFVRGKNPDYQPIRAVIVETEGYETNEDVTKQRYCMLAAPGQIDVMQFRGYVMLNIGTKQTSTPSCVMIRTVSIGDEIIDGPGRVCKELNAQGLVGKVIGRDVMIEGKTAASGFMPGDAAYSTGKYRMQ